MACFGNCPQKHAFNRQMGLTACSTLPPDIALGGFVVPKIVERVIGIEPTTTCLGKQSAPVFTYKPVYLPEGIYA